MLSLTKKADYAFAAMAELARRGRERVSARVIAGSTGVSLPVLTNVLHQLAHYGLVSSAQGSKGGYRLARCSDQISLADMIDAIQGPIKLTACCPAECSDTEDSTECDLEDSCRIKEPVRRVHEGLRAYLSGVSLAELARDEPIQIGVEATDSCKGTGGSSGG